jgi:hypothetical protein
VLWCALAAPGQAQADKRLAPVIGNAACGHQADLPNVPNDAAAMAALFWRPDSTVNGLQLLRSVNRRRHATHTRCNGVARLARSLNP